VREDRLTHEVQFDRVLLKMSRYLAVTLPIDQCDVVAGPSRRALLDEAASPVPGEFEMKARAQGSAGSSVGKARLPAESVRLEEDDLTELVLGPASILSAHRYGDKGAEHCTVSSIAKIGFNDTLVE
jgi:hypothetical protein